MSGIGIGSWVKLSKDDTAFIDGTPRFLPAGLVGKITALSRADNMDLAGVDFEELETIVYVHRRNLQIGEPPK